MNNPTDDLDRFQSLLKKPRVAWPTLMLLLAAYALFSVATFAFFTSTLSLGWMMALNSIASYMAFTVAHDATHSAVTANRKVNDWVGRLAILLLEPGPFFLVFRFIHMQHHRFTNDPIKDPDAYSGSGPAWLLPFKWLTLDFVYFKRYLKPDNFQKRPKSEQREFYFAVLFVISVITAVSLAGWFTYYLLLFFIPTRIAKLIIVLAFDFLPHHPHNVTAREDPYRATSNRVGLEWALTPLFLYQNYHLVHHLYPAVPFYRNLKIWNARRGHHESQDPATVGPFGLKPRSRSSHSSAP